MARCIPSPAPEHRTSCAQLALADQPPTEIASTSGISISDEGVLLPSLAHELGAPIVEVRPDDVAQPRAKLPPSYHAEVLDLARVFRVAESPATTATTRALYLHRFTLFASWCAARGARAMPADPEVLRLYLLSLAAERKALSTLDVSVAAITMAHRALGHEPPASDELRLTLRSLRLTLRSLRQPLGPDRPRPTPISLALLRQIVVPCERDPHGIRDRALILVTYFAGLRRTETAGLNREAVHREERGYRLTLDSARRDLTGAPPLLTSHAEQNLCPVLALNDWLDVRAAGAWGPSVGHARPGLRCLAPRRSPSVPPRRAARSDRCGSHRETPRNRRRAEPRGALGLQPSHRVVHRGHTHGGELERVTLPAALAATALAVQVAGAPPPRWLARTSASPRFDPMSSPTRTRSAAGRSSSAGKRSSRRSSRERRPRSTRRSSSTTTTSGRTRGRGTSSSRSWPSAAAGPRSAACWFSKTRDFSPWSGASAWWTAGRASTGATARTSTASSTAPPWTPGRAPAAHTRRRSMTGRSSPPRRAPEADHCIGATAPAGAERGPTELAETERVAGAAAPHERSLLGPLRGRVRPRAPRRLRQGQRARLRASGAPPRAGVRHAERPGVRVRGLGAPGRARLERQASPRRGGSRATARPCLDSRSRPRQPESGSRAPDRLDVR